MCSQTRAKPSPGWAQRRLRDLVLVVGKHQVVAAAVDVERRAQDLARHGRALDVPAGAAAAPGAVPAGLVVGGGLPEDEIHRIALVGRDLDPGAGDHVVDRAAREAAVVGVALHREEDVALGLIGVALGDEITDHFHHMWDVIGGTRLMCGVERAEGGHVLAVPAGRLAGDVADRAAALDGAREDLVVDVGDVAHIDHPLRAIDVAQQPEKRVEDDDGARIAQMGPVIDGRAADIEAHPTIGLGDGIALPVERVEIFLAVGGGVGQADLDHRASRGAVPRALARSMG